MGQSKISVSVVALVALLSVLTQGATLPKSSPLKFIGSYTSSSLVRGTATASTSLYFFSQNAASYASAIEDCRAFLGPDANLLCIEDEAELEEVTKLVRDSDDTGSSYWVGGRYEASTKKFTWETGSELAAWAPWDAGFPGPVSVPAHRVLASTVGDLKLRTQFNTESSRYICELQV